VYISSGKLNVWSRFVVAAAFALSRVHSVSGRALTACPPRRTVSSGDPLHLGSLQPGTVIPARRRALPHYVPQASENVRRRTADLIRLGGLAQRSHNPPGTRSSVDAGGAVRDDGVRCQSGTGSRSTLSGSFSRRSAGVARTVGDFVL